MTRQQKIDDLKTVYNVVNHALVQLIADRVKIQKLIDERHKEKVDLQDRLVGLYNSPEEE